MPKKDRGDIVQKFERDFKKSPQTVQNRFHQSLQTLCLIFNHHDSQAVLKLNKRDATFWRDKRSTLKEQQVQHILSFLLELSGGPELSLPNSEVKETTSLLKGETSLLLKELDAEPEEKLEWIDILKLRDALDSRSQDWLYWIFIFGPLLSFECFFSKSELKVCRKQFLSFCGNLCQGLPGFRMPEYQPQLLLIWSETTVLAPIFEQFLLSADRESLLRGAIRKIRFQMGRDDCSHLALAFAILSWARKYPHEDTFPPETYLRYFDDFVMGRNSEPRSNVLHLMASSFLHVVSTEFPQWAPYINDLLGRIVSSQSTLGLCIKYCRLRIREHSHNLTMEEVLPPNKRYPYNLTMEEVLPPNELRNLTDEEKDEHCTFRALGTTGKDNQAIISCSLSSDSHRELDGSDSMTRETLWDGIRSCFLWWWIWS